MQGFLTLALKISTLFCPVLTVFWSWCSRDFLHPFFLDVFQEHVEIQALQDELSQRDAELKALRTDLASAYGKLKDFKNLLGFGHEADDGDIGDDNL